jgi:transposase
LPLVESAPRAYRLRAGNAASPSSTPNGTSPPWLGLTPSRYQSGRADHVGRITRAGDAGVRAALYEAATTLLGRVTKWSALKSWGVRLARRSGAKKARVAVARKLIVAC